MKYYKLEIYVPETHLEAVKTAITTAGAGKLGNYDCCCWTTPGIGHFRPLANSNPFLGTCGKIEDVPEIKIETICAAADLKSVIAAMRQAHPYETPAFQFWPVEISEKNLNYE